MPLFRVFCTEHKYIHLCLLGTLRYLGYFMQTSQPLLWFFFFFLVKKKKSTILVSKLAVSTVSIFLQTIFYCFSSGGGKTRLLLKGKENVPYICPPLRAKCHVISCDQTNFPCRILKLTLTVWELLHYYLRFAICDCLCFIECSAFVTIWV